MLLHVQKKKKISKKVSKLFVIGQNPQIFLLYGI